MGSYYLHSWEYGSKQGPANKLDEEKANDLRKNHFKEDDKVEYRTSYQV